MLIVSDASTLIITPAYCLLHEPSGIPRSLNREAGQKKSDNRGVGVPGHHGCLSALEAECVVWPISSAAASYFHGKCFDVLGYVCAGKSQNLDRVVTGASSLSVY